MSRTAVRVLIIASLSVVACSGGSAATPTSTASAVVPTLTPTTAPTPVPTPTPVVTPRITTGTLTGELLSAGKHAPVLGAGVILCLKSASGCTTDANLLAISDSSGKFKIDGIPEGSYVVLYSPRGAPGSSANGLDVALDDQTAHCLGVAFAPFGGSVSDSCGGSIPFLDDSDLRALSAQIVNVSETGPRSDTSFESGRVCSSKYGLCLDFEASTPVTAEITAGSTTSVKVTVG